MTSSEKHREADCVTTKEIRDVAPAHYVLHFKSFSLFAKNNMEKYESSEFEAGGCKWKLILYPNGDKSRNGEDHISVYLAVSGTSPFQLGGEIHVAARFSLYDQLCDRYLTEQVRAARLHALKAECGVPRFMPLKIFADPSNGYLVDDTCVFGVEVFVIKSSGVGERLTLKESTSYTHEWKISGLSKLGDEYLVSDVFTLGDHECKVFLYPRGNLRYRGQSLSIFLILKDVGKWATGQKENTSFTFRLKGRDDVVHHQKAGTAWLSSSTYYCGWGSFMPLKTVHECLTEDWCVIEVEVAVLGTVSKLP